MRASLATLRRFSCAGRKLLMQNSLMLVGAGIMGKKWQLRTANLKRFATF